MTPERLEIARRLRPILDKHGWPMGMRLGVPDDGCLIRAGRMGGGWGPREVDMYPTAIPDLDDDLTRLGLLAVVRRAWGNPDLTTMRVVDGWYLTGVPDDQPALWFSNGAPTEEAALLAALEACT